MAWHSITCGSWVSMFTSISIEFFKNLMKINSCTLPFTPCKNLVHIFVPKFTKTTNPHRSPFQEPNNTIIIGI